MIGHETEAERGQRVRFTVGFQKLQVGQAISVGLEDDSTGIAALSDVMRKAGGDDARETSHNTRGVDGSRNFSETFRLSLGFPGGMRPARNEP
jgi:hypothetical protein